MIIISHRGYENGPNELLENNPEQIKNLLNKNIHVEIDVWYVGEKLYLGHDEPQHEVDLKFLENDKLWCHAKNLPALEHMLQHNVHCFWHQEDDHTITSRGFIWSYPGKSLTPMSICVLPELKKQDYKTCYGVCTDYPMIYKEQK